MEEKDLILDEELEALNRELREAQAMFDPENHVPAISGTALMDLDFPPTEQIVKGLITKGLSILSGAPKVGKSWLAMDLCLHVAKGEPFWGMEVSQGTAWYLSLEDEGIYFRSYEAANGKMVSVRYEPHASQTTQISQN